MFNRIKELLDSPAPPEGSAQAAWDSSRRNLKEAWRQVERSVADNPGAALAVAFTLGVAVAWWFKRR
jgi:hypothetical protein